MTHCSEHPLTQKPKRILLKLSGEALANGTKNPFDGDFLRFLAREIALIHQQKTSLALLCGGGNIFRGGSAHALPGLNRVSSDHMGMLATIINALALEGALAQENLETILFSAFPVGGIGELFTPSRARKNLSQGKILILAGGTGNPFFTTDSAAILRACELECDLVIKGTKIDGIYDADPKKNPKAKKIDSLTYQHAIDKKLEIMDQTAFQMADDNSMPIIVCSIQRGHAFHHIITNNYPHSAVYR